MKNARAKDNPEVGVSGGLRVQIPGILGEGARRVFFRMPKPIRSRYYLIMNRTLQPSR